MGGPQISGLYSNYRKHDGLIATCRTRQGLIGYRDNLTWFINDRNVSWKNIIIRIFRCYQDTLGVYCITSWKKIFVRQRNCHFQASHWTASHAEPDINSVHTKDAELQLRVPLTPDNFQRNEMRMRCCMMRTEKFTRIAEVSAHVLHHRFSGAFHWGTYQTFT